jgi:hypothetical protein
MAGRLLGHGVGAGHASGLAMGPGAVAGNSATASLTVKALAGVVTVTAAAAVAGGTHFALVQGGHGHSHPASRQPAGLASPPRGTESARTVAHRRATSTSPATASKGNRMSAPSATDTARARPTESTIARERSASPRISSDRPATGHGTSQIRRWHGNSTLAGYRGGHGLRSSRSARGRGGHHGRAPGQHLKLRSRHGQSRAEARRSVPPAGGSSARPEGAGSSAAPPGGHGANSRVGSRAEGQAPPPAAAGHTH